MNKNISLAILSCLTGIYCFGQQIFHTADIKISKDYENVYSEKIYSDPLASSFYISIKKGVKMHKHEYHSEHVYIIKGSAKMILGEDTMTIKQGDFIFIRANTSHSVEVISEESLEIISIQAPEFDGSDRVFVE